MNIGKTLVVARREYNETVKTKAFLLGILLMPVLIVGMIFLSAKMSHDDVTGAAGPLRVAVIDHSDRVGAQMIEMARQRGPSEEGAKLELESIPPGGGAQIDDLKQQVREGKFFAAVEVPKEAPEGKGTCKLYLAGSGMDGRQWAVRNLLTETVKRIRFSAAGLDVQQVEALSQPIAIDEENVRVKQGQPSERIAGMMTPFAFLFLLFMGVFGVSQGLLTSVIEEKSSRVVEVLLSAVSPFELMAGKILGMAAVGLTMMVLWAAVGYGAATAKHVQYLVQFANLGQFIMYYVLGFLMISSILAAVGSACNTIKEAQPMMTPLTLMLIIPLGLSLIPPVTPFVMILRITSQEGSVPLWQQIAAPVWVALWVWLTMWAAGRVFRVGLLMYGKPPGLRELARWVRYK
jgi:ABC-2 type transport system permease protein